MFKKILIANRGEIALRIIRTCKEMGIKTVAVYSTADKESLHVRFADEAVCIGPPASSDSYLSIPKIISAAEITNADAVHPGYGFLAENAEFSRICRENNLKFIGASPEMINGMGDKATAKDTMKRAGVPTIPGSDGLIDTVEQGLKLANEMGYPVILKATAGGGGRGMRIVHEDSGFQKAWDDAKRESGAAFGNDGLYLEKYIEEPRHVEIQVLGDCGGKAVHLSERDCSIQRRHQKLVEETPSPAVDEKLRDKMGQAAVLAAEAIKYEGAGTVEFLVDKHRNFYFMEMNTRIQVEHPITEEVTDVDLIKDQIKMAAGQTLKEGNHLPKRFSIECRINAEDPTKDFRPSPGKITNLHFPNGRNVRVDSHVYAGYTIPPNYDSMIAKVIVSGRTRERAIIRMKRALQEMVIEGVKTTIPFHLKLMDDPIFQSGDFTTKFLEDFDFSSIKEIEN
ncbi:MAG: acetyl-CoA carboxylase biotin carboxylase subunit [Cytophagales bacterium]|nr:acetyl-CoA carboxylase biotin carboxylase subunit [Cytophagales bacterium]